MPELAFPELSQAILQTLLYSDIFEFPLTAREVHRYLQGMDASYEDVCLALQTDARLIEKNGYFALRGREGLVSLRQRRDEYSRKLMPHAVRYGRVIGALPFVRMVALTGSLAVMNVSRNADFDYLLVTAPGRLWTARAFALLFARLAKRVGHTICPNVLLTENSLAWKQHDLYSARELCQMIPISGRSVYQKLVNANLWVKDFLPNAWPGGLEVAEPLNVSRWYEFPLLGKLGDRFERWEMNRKIARFSIEDGFGDETVFSAEICQGNFDHHRQRTRTEMRQRVGRLEMEDVPVKAL